MFSLMMVFCFQQLSTIVGALDMNQRSVQEILSNIAVTIIAVEYWYDVSNELLLETSMKAAHEVG